MAPEPDKRKTRNASAKDKKAETAKAADDIVIPNEELQILVPVPLPKPPQQAPLGGASRDPPPIVEIKDQISHSENERAPESSSDSSDS